jgi:hypothetical protein
MIRNEDKPGVEQNEARPGAFFFSTRPKGGHTIYINFYGVLKKKLSSLQNFSWKEQRELAITHLKVPQSVHWLKDQARIIRVHASRTRVRSYFPAFDKSTSTRHPWEDLVLHGGT